jgi:hypothetical protein
LVLAVREKVSLAVGILVVLVVLLLIVLGRVL